MESPIRFFFLLRCHFSIVPKCVRSGEKSYKKQCVIVRGGKMINCSRRTWITIYKTLKGEPEHVFLSVILHDPLMDTQKLTCFLFHCFIPCPFRTENLFFWGFSLCFFGSPVWWNTLLSLFPFICRILYFFYLDFFSQPGCLLSCVHTRLSFPPCCPLSFSPPIFLRSLFSLPVICFGAMLSSPTVILQPYGLSVYPQTTTCYPSIVQVNTFCLFCSHKFLSRVLSVLRLIGQN